MQQHHLVHWSQLATILGTGVSIGSAATASAQSTHAKWSQHRKHPTLQRHLKTCHPQLRKSLQPFLACSWPLAIKSKRTQVVSCNCCDCSQGVCCSLCVARHRKGYSNSWITLWTAVMCVWGEGGGHGYLSLVLHDFRGESGQGPIKLLRHYGLKGTTVLVLLPQQPHRLHRQTPHTDCTDRHSPLTAYTITTH